MDTVEIVTLIKTTLGRRGDGTESNPFRVLTEYWTLDGEKVFEIDPTKNIKKESKDGECIQIGMRWEE